MSNQPATVKEGDLVRLKTNNGPVMVAAEIDKPKSSVYVEYWLNDAIQQVWVKLVSLRLATEDEIHPAARRTASMR